MTTPAKGQYPTDLRYTRENEWARILPDGTCTVGITAYATDELGDIVFVEMPKIGARFTQFSKFGEIESVKTVSDLFLPLAGEVIEVNPRIKLEPEIVNRDPYGEGWLIKVRLSDASQTAKLLNSQDYERTLGEHH